MLDTGCPLCYSVTCVKAQTIKQSIRSHLATIGFASVHSRITAAERFFVRMFMIGWIAVLSIFFAHKHLESAYAESEFIMGG